MKKLKEMLDKLEHNISVLKIAKELSEKGYTSEEISTMLLNKKYEDGLIANFHNANIFQLKVLRSNPNFRYYEKKYVIDIIDAEIKNKIRLSKLNRIID